MSSAAWSLRRTWRVFAAYGAFTAWGLACLVASVLLILGEQAVPAITSSLLLTMAGIVGSTIAGHLLGNAIALLRLRLWVLVVVGGAVAVGLTLGSELLGPAGAFLVVGALAAGGGYFGIASRMDIIAAWLPLSYAMGAAVLWMNNHDKVSVWLTGAKFAVWDAVTFAFLSGAVLLFLMYLMTRHALALTLWQAGARPGGDAAIGVDVDARSGRGSIAVLLALTGLVLVTTAVISPFLFRSRALQGTHQTRSGASTHPSSYTVSTSKGPWKPSTRTAYASARSRQGVPAAVHSGSGYGVSSSGVAAGTWGGPSSPTTSPTTQEPDSTPPRTPPPPAPPPKSCVPGEPGFDVSCLTSLTTASANAGTGGSVNAVTGAPANTGAFASVGTGASVNAGSGAFANGGAIASASAGTGASAHAGTGASASANASTGANAGTSVSTNAGAPATVHVEPNWSSDDPYADVPGPQQALPQPNMERAATQSVEVAKMGLSVVGWLVVLLGLLLLLAVFFRPLRRAIVLRHLERPLWRTTPTRRVENLWLRAIVALADAGVSARSNETPRQLAHRAREELAAKHGEVPASLAAAASIIERIEYAGRGLDVGEEARMRTAVLALVGSLSRHVAIARKLGQAWAPVPRR